MHTLKSGIARTAAHARKSRSNMYIDWQDTRRRYDLELEKKHSMQYKFPQITHIDQVLEAIQGYNNFVVRRNDKSGFSTIDYTYATQHTFSRDDPNWEMLRECRGIAFSNSTGEVVSRPFHKFFNYGEKPECSYSIVKGMSFSAEPKLDGSMIRAIRLDYKFDGVFHDYVLATRVGVTDHSIKAQNYITPEINQFILHRLMVNQTPIFEFIGPENINVLYYPQGGLKLLAVRDNLTGEYVKREHILELENIEAVPFSLDFVKDTSGKIGIEGYVLVSEDGQHRMKVKTEDYCMKHRAKDRASTERAVLEVFFSNQWDDFFSILPDGERKDMLGLYVEKVQAGIDHAYGVLKFISSYGGPNKLNKKEFALHVNNDDYTRRASSILFKLYDFPDSNLYTLILAYGLRNCSSSAKIENMRWLIGNHKFTEESPVSE